MTDKILIDRSVLQQARDALNATDTSRGTDQWDDEYRVMKKLSAALAAPQPAQDSTCSEALRAQGKAYPRTCKKCGLGPCVAKAPQPAQPISRDLIKDIFMKHGFTIKDGQTDLKEYVYSAAVELIHAALAAPQPAQPAEPVACGAPCLFVSPVQLEHFPAQDEYSEHGQYIPARKTASGLFTQPLFTAPQPQRQPLTKHQRQAIERANTTEGYHGDYYDAFGIIDDVEAAHGITKGAA